MRKKIRPFCLLYLDFQGLYYTHPELFIKLKKSTSITLQTGWLKYLLQILVATTIMASVLLFIIPDLSQWLTWSVFVRIGALLGFMLSGAVLYIVALVILGVRKDNFAIQ